MVSVSLCILDLSSADASYQARYQIPMGQMTPILCLNVVA